MLRKTLARRERRENGDIAQTIIVIAGFAILMILGVNMLSSAVQGKSEAIASKILAGDGGAPVKIEKDANDSNGKIKIEQNDSPERQTTGAKLASDEYYAAYSAINSKPNSVVAKQIEEFRVQNTGVTGKELRLSNLSNPNQRNTLDPEYDTFLVTHDGLGTLDLVIEYDDSEYSSRVSISYLTDNPQKEGL